MEVVCASVEEKLLLMVVDRLEQLEACMRKKDENPLENIQPTRRPSALDEGRDIAKRLRSTQLSSFPDFATGSAVSCQIKHSSNIDLLRRQGFMVSTAGLTNHYIISWPLE